MSLECLKIDPRESVGTGQDWPYVTVKLDGRIGNEGRRVLIVDIFDNVPDRGGRVDPIRELGRTGYNPRLVTSGSPKITQYKEIFRTYI